MIDAVSSAFAILEEIAKSDAPRGVTEVATAISVPKARVYRHLVALCALGYLEQVHGAKKYRVTAKLFTLGQVTADRLPWLTALRTSLSLLRDHTGHSIALSVVDGLRLQVLENYRGDAVIDISVRAGSLLPLHATAQGKVALAFGEPEMLEACLGKDLTAFTTNTVTDPTTLRRQVENIRGLGWGASVEEIELGFSAIAAPVFSAGGKLLFTFGIIATTDKLSTIDTSPVVVAALRASREISKLMGWRPNLAAS